MAATVEIVIGPARSGKTALLYKRLRERRVRSAPSIGPIETILWIAPTVRAAESIRNHLLGKEYSGCLGVSVVTFDQFAKRVVEASLADIRPISRTLQRRLLRQLIQEAHSGGHLRYFAPIAETEGYLDLVIDFIRDLKRREIWPEHFASAGHQEPGNTKAGELAHLYGAYQEILNKFRLYDPEGRFWVARSFLRDGQRRPFETLQSLIVDGFTDFTRTQHEILGLLAEWVDRITISLPADQMLASDGELGVLQNSTELAAGIRPHGKGSKAPMSGRGDLFSKSIATLAELRRRHRGATVTAQSEGNGEWPAMKFIEQNLFRPPQQVRSPPPAITESFSRIRVLRGASDVGEIAAVAGQIKRLLARGQAKPGEILVVARSLKEQASVLQGVFSQFGIPFSIEARKPIASSALIRGLRDLLELDLQDWPFSKLLAVITNCAVDWQNTMGLRNVTGSSTARRAMVRERIAAERVVRVLQIDHGRQRLLDRVSRLAAEEAEAAVEPGPDDESATDVRMADSGHRGARTALPFLARIAKALDAMPQAGTPSEWSDSLDDLARRIGFETDGDPDDAHLESDRFGAVSRAAWHRLAVGLASVEQLATWLNEPAPQLDQREIIELIGDIASVETLPAEHDNIGWVRIESASSVRAIRAPYLFVVGLSEGSFPQPHREDRLFSEMEVAGFVRAGLPLETRDERNEEEMLLFYEVLTRADIQLTLSYPSLDDKATPLPPSPFVQEFERLCGDWMTPIDCLDLGPVNRQFEPCSPSEFRVRAVADAVASRSDSATGDRSADPCKRLAQLLAHPSENQPAAAIDAGLRITAARASGTGFGSAEGVVVGRATRTEMARRFGKNYAWSTTQLEQYGHCPFQFYSERLLDLEPLGDLQLQSDYRNRGKLIHDVLATFHAELRDLVPGQSLTSAWDEAAFLDRLQEGLQLLIGAKPLWGVDAALQELDHRQALEWVANYFQQHENYDRQSGILESPFVPAHFEIRFGPSKHVDDVPDDSLSGDVPFILNLNDGTIQITGRIDRIDLGKVAGQTVFNLVDYKTGTAKAVTDQDIELGTRLQIPLYVMAIEEHLLKESGAVPWQADYWWLKGEGFGKPVDRKKGTAPAFQLHEMKDGKLVQTERWTRLRKTAIERVGQIVSGIRTGKFPMHSPDDDCTRRCPFRTICRVGQVRALGKQWPPEGEAE